MYKFLTGKNFEDTVVYNLLTNLPSPRPCYDVITYTPINIPYPLNAADNSGHIKASEIPTDSPYLLDIEFRLTLSNLVNPLSSPTKTFANLHSEFMVGHCDRTLVLDPDYTYASEIVTVTR